ncbi:MAG: redoxin domain-containing protein [Deltaproteobacteria bacterium]|nr:redoxin domain-containing protein [Deltaproteobacteria bacterium]MCW5805355.1 redoxin domain-containing protein [Deltaproteobacteria bacterium]
METRPTPLPAGTKAPDFELRSTPDQRIALSSFLGRPVVLVFYPADWSPVCGDQLALYNELQGEWRRHRAQLLAISVDGTWSHIAFAHDRKLCFPLLSDFEPKGEVAMRYGAYEHGDGVAARALFVIDPDGVIAWSCVTPQGVNPGADGILEALDALDANRPQPQPPAPQGEAHV